MSAVIEVDAKDFHKMITEAEKPIVVEFWVRSCNNCRKFKAIYEQLPKVFGDQVVFCKINMFKTMENLKLAESFNITETPTTKIFYQGNPIGEVIGYRTLDVMIDEVNTILLNRQKLIRD
ncbi:MAG: thioredoxin fold domain-containing protein [Candidatus Bathyarchaeota archaeon]|nr:MAG: thioredoxin fold domain-containing protein [Candidatus Bathyarchaeota archaeon]